MLDEHIYCDEQFSGRGHRRQGFANLMQAVGAGNIDVVIIFTTSRLFRKTYRTLQFVEEQIVDRKLRCVFVKSGVDTDDNANWRKLLHVHALVDEMVVQLQVAHIQAAHEGQLRLQLVFGTLTYGFTGDPIPGQKTKLGRPARRLIVDPKAAKWVKQIFHWFVNDEQSIMTIVRRLNDMMNQPDGPTPPERCNKGRWTYLIVRRLLANPRYRGLWQYGTTEAVWQNTAGYSRQFEREAPLCEMQIDSLRIIDDAIGLKAQQRLLNYHRRTGRRSKDGNNLSRPKLLNGICVCEKHQCELWVGGPHGKYMFCPQCRTDPDRALVRQLPRQLATDLTLNAIANLVRSDPGLVEQLVATTVEQVESLQRPDPHHMEEKRRRKALLTSQIEFILSAPGETEEDQQENRTRLQRYRNERAQVQLEISQLEAALANQKKQPLTQTEARALVDDLANALSAAIGSDDPAVIAAARRIVEAVTGGRIILNQQGEGRRGWLRGRFECHMIRPLLEGLNVAAPATDPKIVEIDFKAADPMVALSKLVKPLYDQNLLIKEIARQLSVGRAAPLNPNTVTKALRFWYESRGLPKPDGQARRSALVRNSANPALYQRIADKVMELVDLGMFLGDIADQLKVDRNTVTAAIKHWHQSRGLPVPDGRSRRKTLAIKQRPKP